MTSKERVRMAIARECPDRVPVNYMANPGIDARLKKHFGLSEKDDEKLRQALGVDFRRAIAPYAGPSLHAEIPGRRIDPLGIRTRWVEHESGGYWDYCDFPLSHATEEQVAAWPFPNPDHYDYSIVQAQCREFGGYGIVLGSAGAGDLLNKTGMLRGVEQALIGLASDEPAQLLLMDRKIALDAEVIRRSLEAAKGAADLVWIGEDLGTQRGPAISTALFRRNIRPRLQKIVDVARSFNVPVMVHSCGSSSWAFGDFIEMGVRAVDTLQPEAENMAPAHLKKTFGKSLAFHGMISTAGPVAAGTAGDVVRNVRETLEIMMPGGGYCLAPTHQLQDNSPTENVLAMYEAAKKYGRYGPARR